MLRKVLKQIEEFKEKYNKYPSQINITKKGYKKLRRELSIIENITDDIKMIYLIEFNILEEE
ncbi:MAG: hypothetical protein Q4D02_01935 [Clostridia bacterium]|nr:hypothetical protein [Clostridia bacterium]